MVSGMLSSVTGAVLTGTAGGRPADCAFGDCQALPSRSNVRLRIHTTMGIHRYTNPSETLVSTAYTNRRHSSLSRTRSRLSIICIDGEWRNMFRNSSSGAAVESAQLRWRTTSFGAGALHCSNVWTQIIWSGDGRESCVSAQGVSAHPPATQWRSNWIEIVTIWESISPTVAVSCL